MTAESQMSEQQNQSWRDFNAMRIALFARLVKDLADNCHLTEAEYLVLLTLSEAPDHEMRSMDLAQKLGWQRSRVSQQLSRMAKRELVYRRVCDTDRRGSIEVLTATGLQRIKTAAPIHTKAVRHCFADVLSDRQLDALSDISQTILEHLESEHGNDLVVLGG